MPELRNATVRIGVPGLNGGGVTNGALASAVADRAPAAGSYITKVAEAGLSGEFALGSLSTGILKVTTTTGDLSIAVGADLPSHTHSGVLTAASFLIDGGGATIVSGIKGDLPPMPFSGTITGVGALADQSGSIVVTCWKDSYANYPPDVSDLLFTLTMSSQIKSPTGSTAYTTTSLPFSAGDVLRFNTGAATSIQRLTLALRIERSV